ncbi:hypothetical protein ONE63_007431 [Megalurothrips usitatus]|uniref:Secreted protein n=1 Tax=Megalurothrips usitatus TaxID=439358 RepID=A0AAV7XRX1_9NEOP|nr:hypothetical protein ONE63_007431 [Megalurothrips usitatus]
MINLLLLILGNGLVQLPSSICRACGLTRRLGRTGVRVCLKRLNLTYPCRTTSGLKTDDAISAPAFCDGYGIGEIVLFCLSKSIKI